MSIHNICLYKEVKKKYIGCNLKTTEFLDCALIGVCAVIRSNKVFCYLDYKHLVYCHDLYPKYWDRYALENSIDLDQTPQKAESDPGCIVCL